MKKLSFFLFLTLSLAVATNVSAQKEGKKDKKDKKSKDKNKEVKSTMPKTELDSVSYALGQNIADNLRKQGLDTMNFEMFLKGIQDVYKNDSMALTMEQSTQILNAYFGGMQERKSKAMMEKGQKYLAENAKKPGVTTTASGLQYEVITQGNGPKPSLTDKVTTHYHGTLTNGEVFDSSVQRGTPATFPLNGVITGWQEALQLMPVGSKWRLTLPYNLAYGDRGTGGVIGPYETLVFEVELISIEGK